MRKVLLLTVFLAVILVACEVKIGDGKPIEFTETKMYEESIPLKNETRLEASVEFAIGELDIGGTDSDLFNGVFETNVKNWKPIFNRQLVDSKTMLEIKHQDGTFSGFNKFNNLTNKWKLAFNREIPLNLQIESGIGETDIILDSLNLNNFKLESGLGETKVKIGHLYSKDCKIRIDGGIGQIEVDLPDHVGIRLKVEKGIGEIKVNGLNKVDKDLYENEEWDKNHNRIELEIKIGVGLIKVI